MPNKQGYKAVLPTTSPSGRVVIPQVKTNPGLMPTNRTVARVNPTAQKRKSG